MWEKWTGKNKNPYFYNNFTVVLKMGELTELTEVMFFKQITDIQFYLGQLKKNLNSSQIIIKTRTQNFTILSKDISLSQNFMDALEYFKNKSK